MTTTTLSSFHNEAAGGASPQLAAADAFAAHAADVTLELAELTAGQLSAVAALMLALDAAEARARGAERRLADHRTHCICHAAGVAAAGVQTAVSALAAEACDVAVAFRAAA